ncbi:TraR/DksA family transcriptional regulator [Chryseobacterium sp. MP_3.2]|uniref:TraR/DksA family transcriptional regulator n=1 Tax=Chryseobacterium sp. MP_3.2 TaxID=3071712 RepID=UPI002E075F78|nr:DnaK suppressor protein [Chryseobacterium sp. MP_3.2]
MAEERERQRYSDNDLVEFKELIQSKIVKAERDLILVRESFINDQNNGTDDTSPTFKAFEEGAETLSKEQNAILAGRQEKFLRELKNALIRIENKTYGICRVTGKLIGKDRLRAVPHATLSIEAKNLQR